MPIYTSYKDANGVQWNIITSATAMFATMDPASERRYDPEPEDQGPILLPALSSAATPAEVAERDRATFVRLRAPIDAYAADHTRAVGLRVTASPSSSWMLWAVVALLLFGGRRGG